MLEKVAWLWNILYTIERIGQQAMLDPSGLLNDRRASFFCMITGDDGWANISILTKISKRS